MIYCFCGDFEEKEEQEELFTFALPGADAVVSLLCTKHPPDPPLWPVRAQDLRPPATHPRPTCACRERSAGQTRKATSSKCHNSPLNKQQLSIGAAEHQYLFCPVNHVRERAGFEFSSAETYVFCYCSGLGKKRESKPDFPYFPRIR